MSETTKVQTNNALTHPLESADYLNFPLSLQGQLFLKKMSIFSLKRANYFSQTAGSNSQQW